MNKKLKNELTKFIDLVLTPRDFSPDKPISWMTKNGIGTLEQDACDSFGKMITLLRKDDKTSGMKKEMLEEHLWAFVYDIKTNPEKYKDGSLNEIDRFYKELIKKDVMYEVLLPLKNITLNDDIIYSDFKFITFTEAYLKEWEKKPTHLTDVVGHVVAITQVSANSNWKALERGKNKLLTCISLMQILPRQTRVSIIEHESVIYIRHQSQQQCGWSRLERIGWPLECPQEDDLVCLNALNQMLMCQNNDMNNRLFAALKFCADAMSELNLKLKVIKCFISLETIFIGEDNKKAAKKYKIMFRVALFYSRLGKGFPSPEQFPYMYDKRSEYIHQAQEEELCEVDLIHLKKEMDSLIFWTTRMMRELIILQNEKKFKSHKTFLKWLLKKDDIYQKSRDWFELIGWPEMNELK
ncbi:MAG: HEPN domain-containing protein [Thermoplasmata archaeon]|nr:HEPN domain-containing protein [Thermoplasmata archaeon]